MWCLLIPVLCAARRINYLWAMVYNVLMIPVAAGAAYPFIHVQMPPWLAGGCMALSSVSVVMSSLMLRWYRPPTIRGDASGRSAGSGDGSCRGAGWRRLMGGRGDSGRQVPGAESSMPGGMHGDTSSDEEEGLLVGGRRGDGVSGDESQPANVRGRRSSRDVQSGLAPLLPQASGGGSSAAVAAAGRGGGAWGGKPLRLPGRASPIGAAQASSSPKAALATVFSAAVDKVRRGTERLHTAAYGGSNSYGALPTSDLEMGAPNHGRSSSGHELAQLNVPKGGRQVQGGSATPTIGADVSSPARRTPASSKFE
jgi:hypothetical protein